VAAARQGIAQLLRPLHDAAVSEFLGGATRNESVAGVRVLVGVPKGVTEGQPGDTEVLLYIHGEEGVQGNALVLPVRCEMHRGSLQGLQLLCIRASTPRFPVRWPRGHTHSPTGGGYIAGSCDNQLSTVAATAAGAGLVIMCPGVFMRLRVPAWGWLTGQA
jgi:hypothetical protein